MFRRLEAGLLRTYVLCLILRFAVSVQSLCLPSFAAVTPSAQPGHAGQPSDSPDWSGWAASVCVRAGALTCLRSLTTCNGVFPAALTQLVFDLLPTLEGRSSGN